MPLAGATDASLGLHVVHPYHTGAYALQVSNALGTVLSAPAHLDVTPIPPSGIGGVDVDFFGPTLGLSDSNSIVIRSLLVQTDEKVIVAGNFQTVNGNRAQQLVRLNRDGTVDPSFSVFQNPNPAPFERFEVTTVVLQQDGRILAARRNWDAPSPVMRLRTDGSVDPSFSAQFTSPQTVTSVDALALQQDGKVLCAGMFSAVNQASRTNLARLNTDGSVDDRFAGPAVEEWERITTVAAENNGQILAGFAAQHPASQRYPALVRLNSDGALDCQFKTVITHVESFEELHVLAVQPDGSVFIGGRFTHVSGIRRDGIARLTPGGELDESFVPPLADSHGWTHARARALAVEPDGQSLWVLERDNLSSPAPQKIVRLNRDGSLDPSFAPAAVENHDPLYPWEVTAVALTPQAGLLIGGRFTEVGGVARPVLARLYIDNPILLKLGLPSRTDAGWRVFVPTVHGRSYTIENTSDLRRPWNSLSTFLGEGGFQSIILPNGSSQGLFRLRSN